VPLWLLVASVPAGVAAGALVLSGLGNGFRVPAMQARAASSSMAMLGGALALAVAGPIVEEFGTTPAFAGVAVLSAAAAWAGIVATGRGARRRSRTERREFRRARVRNRPRVHL